MRENVNPYKIKGRVQFIIYKHSKITNLDENILSDLLRIKSDGFAFDIHSPNALHIPIELHFDSRGFLILRKTFLSTEKFQYSDDFLIHNHNMYTTQFGDGLPRESTLYYFNGDGTIKATVTPNYVKNNDETELEINDEIQSFKGTIYLYDANKRLCEVRENAGTSDEERIYYSYSNINSDRVTVNKKIGNPRSNNGTWSEYSKNNQLLETEWKVDNSIGLIENYRTSDSTIERRTHWNKKSEKILYRFEYTLDNEIKKVTLERRDNLSISEEILSIDIIEFKYLYDKIGNWILRQEYLNNIEVKAISRQIIYY